MPRDAFNRDDPPEIETVLDTIADEDCRALIHAMNEPRTAAELSEVSGIPLSTTYRKIEQLSEASLVDELIEIRDDGRHTSRYYPHFQTIEISLTEERNMELDITRPARTADERLEDLWSEIRRGVS